jgi:hypothetical protein
VRICNLAGADVNPELEDPPEESFDAEWGDDDDNSDGGSNNLDYKSFY